jgi:hypothetical protein
MNREELEKILFNDRTLVYSVLDGALIKDLRMKLFEMRPPHYCLFPGELTPDVEEAAPYVVQLVPGAPFSEWLLSEFFGKNWGIFVHCPNSIKEMRRHFRGLVKVVTDEGKPMLFRFYDPRVIRRFLPTCNAGELKTFFGKATSFFVEGEEGGLERFGIHKDRLERKDVARSN